jgi:hypothetical protein
VWAFLPFIVSLGLLSPFPIVIKPVCFGGDDCDFFLLFLLSGLIMVGNLCEDKGVSAEDSWVGKEALETASHFSSDGAGISALPDREEGRLGNPSPKGRG